MQQKFSFYVFTEIHLYKKSMVQGFNKCKKFFTNIIALLNIMCLHETGVIILH